MPANKADPVEISMQGKVLTLRLNTPPAHALSSPMIDTLQTHLDSAAQNPEVNVIVLAASGRIFCAGHDLKEMARHRSDPDDGKAYFTDPFTRCSTLMKSITRSPKPVIAMIDGLATAAGCQLVASCDLAFASDRAEFCTPGVNMGGFCTTPLVALSRNVGRKHAMDMALSGARVDAHTARDMGLINRVIPTAELDQHVTTYATRLATRSPQAVAAGKRAFYAQLDMPLDDAYDYGTRVMTDHFLTRDGKEGMTAFSEKRPPVWQSE